LAPVFRCVLRIAEAAGLPAVFGGQLSAVSVIATEFTARRLGFREAKTE
jgi:hypothetical protein